MTPFEDELKRALARCEPPEGFTERLAAKISSLPPARRRPPYWGWAAIAALLAMVTSVGYQQHERVLKGEAAKEKLLMAMRITSSAIQHVQQEVNGVNQ